MATCNNAACGHQTLTTETGRIEVSWNRRRPDGTAQDVRIIACESCLGNTLDGLATLIESPDMLMENPTPPNWPEGYSF